MVVNITNSTISGNDSGGDGGGIYAGDIQNLNLYHVTVANNSATGNGDGLAFADVSPAITNSILGDNGTQDCHSLNSNSASGNGYNILDNIGNCFFTGSGTVNGSNPSLAPLSDNGGATMVHGLYSDSPALDAISNGSDGCGSTYTIDQIDTSRPQRTDCDSGAFESVCNFSGNHTITTEDGLNEAIACYNRMVSGNYVIRFNSNINLSDELTPIDNSFGATLEVRGRNYEVDGVNSYRVLHINDGDVSIDALEIMNGYYALSGAGIYISGGSLTLTDSYVAGNVADAGVGAGIYSYYGDFVDIQNSLFENNSSGDRGGAIYLSQTGVLLITAL